MRFLASLGMTNKKRDNIARHEGIFKFNCYLKAAQQYNKLNCHSERSVAE